MVDYMSEMTKSLRRHYMKFRERTIEEAGFRTFPKVTASDGADVTFCIVGLGYLFVFSSGRILLLGIKYSTRDLIYNMSHRICYDRLD